MGQRSTEMEDLGLDVAGARGHCASSWRKSGRAMFAPPSERRFG
jgi:hypothetical protein